MSIWWTQRVFLEVVNSFVTDRVIMPPKRKAKAPRTTQQSAGKRRKPASDVVPDSLNAPSLEAPLIPAHAQPLPDVSVSATTSSSTAPATASAPLPATTVAASAIMQGSFTQASSSSATSSFMGSTFGFPLSQPGHQVPLVSGGVLLSCNLRS